ncbi:MAG: hypothetical protein U1C73_05345, partial [Dietzia sp.]|nr:hypothetical protein [Dietzia sp.]
SGSLPPGYAPLPSDWVTQATVAATKARQGVATPTPSPTSSNPSSFTSSGGAGYVTPVYAVPPDAAAATAGDAPEAETPITVAELGETPSDPQTEPLAAAVPVGLAAGLVAALAVPLVSRVRRPV